MLLIFGIRVRLKAVGHQGFFCPGCGGDRTGIRKVARRWFTLFFIPIVPLNEVGEVVECETCHRTYDPSVLHRPTTASLHQGLVDAVRAVTVMVVATGDPASTAVRSAALELLASVVPGYDGATLDADLAAIDPAHAERYTAPLADGLDPSGAERLLADVVRVAVADGHLSDDQRSVIDRAGRGLGLSPVHVIGIVTAVAAAPGPAGEGVDPEVPPRA